jgi:Protein of unknown function (DUF2892)
MAAQMRPMDPSITTFRQTTMKTNLSGIDRILRIVLGLLLIGLAANGSIGLWGWIGIVPLATGVIGWCALYAVFGWKTCSMKSRA